MRALRMTSDRPQNKDVENILDIIIYLVGIICLLIVLPFFAAYRYIKLGLNKLITRA